MNKLAVVLGCLVMAGCAPYKLQSTFNQADVDAYLKKGSGTIVGQAFLKTRGGEVRYGAGNEVVLIPATAYVKDVFKANSEHMNYVDPTTIDSRWDDFNKVTIADGSGNFEFNDLPAGQYYLQCEITWEVPSAGLVPNITGATILQLITLGEGQKQKVILTD